MLSDQDYRDDDFRAEADIEERQLLEDLLGGEDEESDKSY